MGANTYEYNENGIRISKSVNGVKHTYVLDGIKILREQYSDVTLDFLYGVDDDIVGFTYNTVPYYYRKNLQGDVIGITDANGTVIVTYEYDAWGKLLSVTGDTVLANINPIRYRGYYYDTETSLYYLNSRYYDPDTCRFINADDADMILERNVHNLFVYCIDNPILYKDAEGYFVLLSILSSILVGAAISIVVGTAVAVAAWSIAEILKWLADELDDIIQNVKEKVKAKKRTKKYKHRHHVIAKLAWRAREAQNIWKKQLGLDINSPSNIAYIWDIYHYYLHTTAYYNFVNKSVRQANQSGTDIKVRTKNVITVVEEIRDRLEEAFG